MKNSWKLNTGQTINLLTQKELENLDPKTQIVNIFGEVRTKIQENLGPPDDDTRCGFTAWGILEK